MNKVRLLTILMLAFFNLSYAQTQIGGDIDGEAAEDGFGGAVSLSADGSRLAVGASSNDGVASGSGHCRVYNLTDSGWVQLGSDIDGENQNDQLGSSVSLSADGNRVAVGAKFGDNAAGENSGHVRIFDFIGGEWVQVGGNIDGENASDLFGADISISADGNRVAIGAKDNSGVNGDDSGHVRVFDFMGGEWIQVGDDIDGEAEDDESGHYVSLSADGSRVAIAARRNDAGGLNNAGHIRIYENLGDQWTQVGEDIDGEIEGDWWGNSVVLSADGNRVAFGAIQNDDNGNSSGQVRVFEYNDSNWAQLGNSINGEEISDLSGVSVAITANGNRVAIGAKQNDGNGSNSGHVRLYDLEGEDWIQIGIDIDGETPEDKSGTVALSADGERLAIGAASNDGSFEGAGHVRVFAIDVISSSKNLTTTESSIKLYPNPTYDFVYLNGIKKGIITISDVTGRIISERIFSEQTIDLKSLSAGIYFLHISNETINLSKKIIKK